MDVGWRTDFHQVGELALDEVLAHLPE